MQAAVKKRLIYPKAGHPAIAAEIEHKSRQEIVGIMAKGQVGQVILLAKTE